MRDISGKLALNLFLGGRRALCLCQGRRLTQVRLSLGLRLLFRFKTVIIDLLLLRCQRGILLLQLKRLDHILPAMEPQDKVITGRKPFLCPVSLNLEAGKLISPLLIVLLIQILLQNINLLIQGSSPSPVDLILQDVLIIIMRGSLDILRIIFDCLVKLTQPDTALHQPVQHRTPQRAAPVGTKKQHLAVIVAFEGLIYLTDHHQCLHIPDPFPVNGVRNLRSPLIILSCDQTVDLLQFFLIFSLVHSVTPLLLFQIKTLHPAEPRPPSSSAACSSSAL